MNGPKWRTYSGYKKLREEQTTGNAWDVTPDGDTVIVRVPTLDQKLRDLSFSFRQDDAFLEALRLYKSNAERSNDAHVERNLSEMIVERLTLESHPTRFRQGRKREDQSTTENLSDEVFMRLNIGVATWNRATDVAARAIAKHFLTR